MPVSELLARFLLQMLDEKKVVFLKPAKMALKPHKARQTLVVSMVSLARLGPTAAFLLMMQSTNISFLMLHSTHATVCLLIAKQFVCLAFLLCQLCLRESILMLLVYRVTVHLMTALRYELLVVTLQDSIASQDIFEAGRQQVRMRVGSKAAANLDLLQMAASDL